MPDTPKARPSRPSRSRTAAQPAEAAPPGDGGEREVTDVTPEPAAAAAPTRATSRWPGGGPVQLRLAVRTGAVGFAAALFIYTVLVVAAGIFYADSDYKGNGADELHRIGLVAARGIDLRYGVGVMLAALLVAMAASYDSEEWVTLISAILVALTCVFGFILAFLVYRYQLHSLTVLRPPRDPTTSFSLGLVAYMFGTAGPCIVGFVVALPALTAGMRPRTSAGPTTIDEVPVGA